MDEFEGGDSACWLSKVCPECGALLDDPAAPCWRCGRRPGEDAPASEASAATPITPPQDRPHP